MSNNADTTLKPGAISSPFGEHAPPRKAYESPRLQEWGSLFELTRGEGANDTDAEGGGSGAF
jgi:hypothetical protein